MTLINEHEGTEEWLCSTCGRHLLVSWDPVFRKTVLLEGDPSAKHTGLKKTISAGGKLDVPAALLPNPHSRPVEEGLNDPWLAPWLTWMEESGFEDLWEEDDR
jgi:hypothetical protein